MIDTTAKLAFPGTLSRAAVFAGAAVLLLLQGGPAHAQQVYPSGEAAADAFVVALRAADGSMSAVLGTDWKQFIPTEGLGDEDVQQFLTAWDEKHAVVPRNAGGLVATAGKSGWILPIPIAPVEGGFSFDLPAAAEMIRVRRIGRDELATIEASLAFYDAQREYAEQDRDGDGFLEYAQRVVSTPGQTDGLYWAALDGEPESPLGPLFGDDQPGGEYFGYYYRILTRQGSDAPGGAYEYVVDGRMRGGFALVAWPVSYDDSGVMTFIVSHGGILYQADLGSETDTLAREITSFDPGEGWSPVKPTEGD